MPLSKSHFQSFTRFIDTWLSYQFPNSNVPGLSIGIHYKKEPLFQKHYGVAQIEPEIPLGKTHLFRLASHAKMFTGVALMKLVEEGVLQLDDPVQRHLRWFQSKRDSRVKYLTVRHLLSHSSGIARDGDDARHWTLDVPFPRERELRDYVKNSKLILNESEEFKYSNIGFAYLGSLIKALTGKSYNDFITDSIIRRVGETHLHSDIGSTDGQEIATGYGMSFYGRERYPFPNFSTNALSPAAGVLSNVEGMVRFCRGLYFGNDKLVSDSGKRELFRTQFYNDEQKIQYGLGFGVDTVGSRRMYGHGGGFPGYVTFTLFDPREEVTVVALTNALDGPAANIAFSIVDLLNYYEATSKMPLPSGVSNKSLRPFECVVFSNWGPLAFGLAGNQLFSCRLNSWNPFRDVNELEYKSSRTLRFTKASGFDVSNQTVKFSFDKHSRVKQVVSGGYKFLPWESFERECCSGVPLVAK